MCHFDVRYINSIDMFSLLTGFIPGVLMSLCDSISMNIAGERTFSLPLLHL